MCPKVSVIIPSYNQGNYLEETIISIINQNYPSLELIVIDGGSTDNSVDIIKKHESKIAYWVSEKDKGQSHAINKGIEKATGEWIAWMNSDDCYLPAAFEYVFNTLPHNEYDFLFGNTFIGSEMGKSNEYRFPSHTKKNLSCLLKFFYNVRYIIPSQSVFIRRSIIDKVGLLNEDLHYCMDMDWYCRIFLTTEKRLFYEKSICFFRVNESTKTGSSYDKMQTEAIKLLYKYLPSISKADKKSLLNLLFLHRVMRKVWNKKIKISLSFFARILYTVPVGSISDRRFLGMLKKKILSFS